MSALVYVNGYVYIAYLADAFNQSHILKKMHRLHCMVYSCNGLAFSDVFVPSDGKTNLHSIQF